ncbi:MAG: YbaB/EbfC family nucleoid-associated protein [Litorilinea sp.]
MAKRKSGSKKPRSGGGGFGGGGFGGGGGLPGGGMGGLMSQVQKLQAEMEEAQATLEEEEITVTSGGGMVTVVMTGGQVLKSITIDPQAVDPEDVEMLQDLIMAAVNESYQKIQELQEERMGGLTGGLGLPPGLGL